MDTVSALSRAISTLQRQLASTGRSASISKTPRAVGSPRPQGRETASSSSQVAGLAIRLEAVVGTDAERAHQQLRLFLEAVLMDEFGATLSLAAEFQELVDRVVRSVEQDPDSRQLVGSALRELGSLR